MIFSLARKLVISSLDWASVRVVAFATIALTTTILGVRYLGELQPLELVVFDQLMRLRTQETEADPRILLVAITEKDLRSQNQWPLSDQVLAKLLSKLQAAQPAVIGLDLYRNLPVKPGYDELIAQLKQSNLMVVQRINTLTGVAAPSGVSTEQIGFNDLAIDPDDVVRRNILFAENEQGTLYSFSLRLALAYLETQGISPEPSQINPEYLQLGEAVFVPLTANSGQYQAIDAQGYQVLLNYRSAGQVARQVTISEVLNGAIEPGLVKDKIVLIGSIAPSLKDTFATPYSPALRENHKMPGVVIHAQMVSQILDAATGRRLLFSFWPEWGEIFWIISWIGLGGIIGRITYHPLALSVSAVVSLTVLFATGFYLFSKAIWVPLAAPAGGFVLTVAVVVTYRSYHAHQKQQIVMKLLGQNTSPEIAQALWQGRDRLLKSGKLPGTNLTATMLFADVVGFSTISEQMSPEALLDWLNELLEVITHEVIIRQGVVNKFTGDGVMAVFGVPTSRLHQREVDQDARATVACALAISDRLKEMNRNWQSRNLPVIQMRVGIFTGSIVAGSLGGKDRLEYGIIGDSVNIASRLESCRKDQQPTNCRILIGKETLVHLQGEFPVESWGPLILKGKQQMIDVYRVLDN
ncbi:CHASE2 domain-containing protein [Lyngbya aestuarii]|uniref:CHASE2 domain-containing protein n=1 Tax=Lyngbya aestuarii TaxID=118322 RepID=UPI00403D94D8